MESRVSLGRKECHTKIQISAKPRSNSGELVVGRQRSYQLHHIYMPAQGKRVAQYITDLDEKYLKAVKAMKNFLPQCKQCCLKHL